MAEADTPAEAGISVSMPRDDLWLLGTLAGEGLSRYADVTAIGVRGRRAPSRLRSRIMSKPKLMYFDSPASRGEECRLALHIAGVDFEDERIQRAEWAARKPKTPFGAVPVLEMPGHPPLAQSNAILTLVGRLYGLHPKDPFEAARDESMMEYVEDLRATVGPTLRITDEVEKKKAREQLAATFLPTWGANAEKQIGDGPYFDGAAIHVVDLKLHMAIRWLRSGALDHIPPSIFDAFPKLNRLADAVRDHDRVKHWYATRR